MAAYTDPRNVNTVVLYTPKDIEGETSDIAVVDAIDLKGFAGEVNFIKLTWVMGDVGANYAAFDLVTSDSADLSTPTVVQALTEPLAASSDNDSFTWNIDFNDLAGLTQRYFGIRATGGGSNANLAACTAAVWTNQSEASIAATGKNFNASPKTVTVADVSFS